MSPIEGLRAEDLALAIVARARRAVNLLARTINPATRTFQAIRITYQ